MTKEQNIVITFYGVAAAFSAGVATHKASVFFLVAFVLAYILKLANSLYRPEGY